MDLEFGEFRLLRQQRQLAGPKGEIEIGGRSFEILVVLLDHANSTVSKNDLLDEVWPGVAVEENTLQVHVVALRKVLGEGMIATIHGRGYKYVGPLPVEMKVSSDVSPNPKADRKPALMVLPFEDLSVDQSKFYLAHSISADLIDQLSKYRSISVFGHTPSFSIQGRSMDLSGLRTQSGADYLVTGNLRKSAKGARIAARLTDAQTGTTIWADHFDWPEEADQAYQDEVANGICSTLFNSVQNETATRGISISPTGLTSHELTLQGLWHFKKLTRSACKIAASCFQEAIKEKSDNAEAYRGLAMCENNRWLFDFEWEGLERCLAYAQRAVELDPTSAVCHAAMGFSQLWIGGVDDAEKSYARALRLNPGDPHILAEMALLNAYRGRVNTSRDYAAHVLLLDPLPPVWYAEFGGVADFVEGQYQSCLEAFSAVTDGAWDVMYALSCLGLMGDANRSRQLRERLKAAGRDWDFIAAARREPFADAEPRARLIDGLEIALSF